jgi:hypothetical protein
MGTAAGIRRFAIIAVLTIVIGESGTIFASSDDGNSQPHLGYQNLELPHLHGLRPWRCSLLLFLPLSFTSSPSITVVMLDAKRFKQILQLLEGIIFMVC